MSESWRCPTCAHEVIVYGHATAVAHKCKTDNGSKYVRLVKE
jgi:hypothetical protein